MKKIFIFFSLSVLLASCTKMLEEKPEDRLFSEGFYKTSSDAVAAVNAIYTTFKDPNSYAFRYPEVYQAMEDYATGKGQYIFFGQYKALPNTAAAITDGGWSAFYTTINTANIVLKYVPPISMNDNLKNALLGEARFLRAFSYFELVKGWGAIPIKSEVVEGPESVGGKRETVATVYAFIIEDLKFAEANLPSTQNLAGRPTRWSAKTMLADVYLINGDWTNARIKADEVIQSNAYTLVNVKQASDFDLVFSPEYPTSSEDVFSIKFARIPNLGTQVPAFYHNSDAAAASRGFGTFSSRPNYPLIANWSSSDLRKTFNLYTQYLNKSGVLVTNPASEPIRFGKFKDAKAPDNTGHGISYPIYRYPEALLIYAEAASMENAGPTSLAMERLNMVHRRAYGYNPTTTSAVDFNLAGQTQQSFRNLVLTERAYEFMCEHGKRWRDLIRTGTAAQVIKTAKGIDIQPAAYLFPIPQQEIDNNPDISLKDQNPGY